jgi:mRNA-degrading endonuclease HigB of HigAB toxin-antitoxin module
MGTPMETPNIEEYKTIIEQTSSLSDRRQVTNDIYVALNTLFLTGLGFLLTSFHLRTWWPTLALAGVTLVSWIINGTWLGLLRQYRELIRFRVDYLKQLEKHYFSKPGDMKKGIYLAESDLYDNKGKNFGFTRLELRLVWLFLILYPLIAVIVAALTYLQMSGIITIS